MKAIVTHYQGPTTTKPSRIIARAEGGHRVSISMPDEATVEAAHWHAAKKLRDSLGWKGAMVGGGGLKGEVIFVFAESEKFN